jgi:hypothetical protein
MQWMLVKLIWDKEVNITSDFRLNKSDTEYVKHLELQRTLTSHHLAWIQRLLKLIPSKSEIDKIA